MAAIIKSGQLFNIDENDDLSVSEISEFASNHKIRDIGKMETIVSGWSPFPNGEFALESEGNIVLRRMIISKTVPKSLLNEFVEDKIKSLEKESGRDVESHEVEEFEDQAVNEYLPKAFPKTKLCYVLINVQKRLMIVGAGSINAAADIVCETVNELKINVTPVNTHPDMKREMNSWIEKGKCGEAKPDGSCILESNLSAATKVKFTNTDIPSETEIKDYINKGYLTAEVNMVFDEVGSVTIKADGLLKGMVTYGLDGDDMDDADDMDEDDFVIYEVKVQSHIIGAFLSKIKDTLFP